MPTLIFMILQYESFNAIFSSPESMKKRLKNCIKGKIPKVDAIRDGLSITNPKDIKQIHETVIDKIYTNRVFQGGTIGGYKVAAIGETTQKFIESKADVASLEICMAGNARWIGDINVTSEEVATFDVAEAGEYYIASVTKGMLVYYINVKEAGTATAKPAETPSSSTVTVPTEGTYVVKKGDTLCAIARNLFNSEAKWKDIYEMNKDTIKDPSIIEIGQVLKVK